MTDTIAPLSPPTAPAPQPGVPHSDSIAAPQPARTYLTTAQIDAMDYSSLETAMRKGDVHWMNKPDALERMHSLATSPSVTPAPAVTEITRIQDVPSAALPATVEDAARTETLVRKAYTTPPGLPSDYTIPGDNTMDEGGKETNQAIRTSLFAAQMPVAIANTLLQAAQRIAQEIVDLSPEDEAKSADARARQVLTTLSAKWGESTGARMTAARAFMRDYAVKAADAGAPALVKILTEKPELLNDARSLEMLWNAAQIKPR